VRGEKKGNSHVLLEEILREVLNLSREGSREHESLSVVDSGHVSSLDDLPDLG